MANGGSLGVIIIAVVLLYREVMRVQAQREWKKNGGGNDLYTVDPRTGDRISFPALNLSMLTNLMECEREQTTALKTICATIKSHDEPIRQTAVECAKINDKLDALRREG